MTTKIKPYRAAEPRPSLSAPPVRAVAWSVSWLAGNLRRTKVVAAQTAHQAWQLVTGAPHYSACRVRLWGGR